MHNFTPTPALAGGLLIGGSAALMMLLQGRIAGISGILGGLLSASPGDVYWRALFLLGMMGAPLCLMIFMGPLPPAPAVSSDPVLIVAGVLVGFGTRLANGCTSGHGVCGLARRSKRALVATLTFMGSGALTVWLLRHVLAGAR